MVETFVQITEQGFMRGQRGIEVLGGDVGARRGRNLEGMD